MPTGDVSPRPRRVSFGRFELDRLTGELRKDGRKVRLQDQPIQVLEMLIARGGDIVSREEICKRLWPGDTFVDFDNGLNNAISRLRSALGDKADEPTFIETLGRRGYRFIAPIEAIDPGAEQAPSPVAEAADGELAEPGAEALGAAHRPAVGPDAQPAAADHARPAPQAAGQPPRQRVAWAGVALAVAVALGLALSLAWLRRDAVVPPQAEATGLRSVAVLPFRSLSARAEDDYFAEGLTEALTTDLASIGTMRVISYQSALRFKRSTSSLPEIARALGADAIVEGSVIRSGSRIRLTAQLIEAKADHHLWANRYDRDLGDALTLQSELARSIADGVHATISEQEHASFARRHVVDPEAYDLYLRARHLWGLRNEDALRKSLTYYQQAIAKDPTFALAHAGLAQTFGPLAFLGYAPPAEARTLAYASAQRALALDPDLMDAQVAIASFRVIFDWDWQGAEQSYAQLIQRMPHSATARLWHGHLYQILGRLDDAIRERRAGLDDDPLALFNTVTLGDVMCMANRCDEGITFYRRALDLDPAFPIAKCSLGWAELTRGATAQGLADLEAGVQLSGDDPRYLSWLGHAYGVTGDVAKARAILTRLETRARERYLPPLFLAQVHAALGPGDRDAAFAQLEAAFQDRSPNLLIIKTNPLLAPLQADPRFRELLRRLNLPL